MFSLAVFASLASRHVRPPSAQPGFAQRPDEENEGTTPQIRTHNVTPEGRISLEGIKHVTVGDGELERYRLAAGGVQGRITEHVAAERTAGFARPRRQALIDQLSTFQHEVWNTLRYEWRGAVLADNPAVFEEFWSTPLEQYSKVQSGPAPEFPPPPPGVQRIRVGGQVQQAKIKKQVPPIYPDLAKQARIQGVVRFNVLIDAEGNMKNVSVVGGHPLLVGPATEAVQQWQYEKTFLNGVPVEVVTQVDVNFTLSQ